MRGHHPALWAVSVDSPTRQDPQKSTSAIPRIVMATYERRSRRLGITFGERSFPAFGLIPTPDAIKSTIDDEI
jgi:hypothetical protein